MEIVEGDGEQCGEVNPDQSHRQPTDEQVRVCSVRAALHGQAVFAEEDDQPQRRREHDHQRHQGEVTDEDDHINIDVHPVGEQRLSDDTSQLFCHVLKSFALEMEVEERSEHHAGGQQGHHHGDVQDGCDVLLERSKKNRGEAQNSHAVENAQPGDGPEADGAAAEPHEQDDTEEER